MSITQLLPMLPPARLIIDNAAADENSSEYVRGEWRMGISLGLPRSRVRLNNETAYALCQDILIQGLSIEQSGGDAIIVEQCQRVHIADVNADGNYRQGMSVIGAKDMLVERCNFSNTCASQPAADLQPLLWT